MHVMAELGAVPGLLKTLDGDDPDERLMALMTLGSMREDAAEAVPAMAALLGRDDPQLVQATIAALGTIGPSSAPAIPALVPLIADRDYREQVFRAFVGIGAPAVEALLAELGDGSRPTIAAVCTALGDIAARPDIAVPALRAILNDRETLHWPMRRAAVAAALGGYGPAARAAIGDLKKALKDDAQSVQQAAAAALAQIEGEESSP